MTVVYRQPPPPHVKRWTKAEYMRMVECGSFNENDHFYLFRGELIEMSPMHAPHAQSSVKTTKLLFSIFDIGEVDIRVQLPFDAPGQSMPEPDFLVCTTNDGRRSPHPSTAILIIELSDSSLAHDRDKTIEYAAASVQEYWIVDLNARCVEVYRNPVADHTAEFGFRYPTPIIVKENESISPLALPQTIVKVADLLP